MIIANNWKEYELLDSGDGAKLEKWGEEPNNFVLSRPDPQILWPKEKPELWDKADGVYTRNKNGGGSWKFNKRLPDRWQINYKNLKFWIRPTNFKHMGLFPEQAINWDWITEKIKNVSQPEVEKIKILNLFAYTGGSTIACAKAGAHVTHVDAARGIIEWAKDNLTLNNLDDKNVRFIVDDVSKFVLREKRRGVKYSAIIMDPPSYGRGRGGETWKIEKMLWPLIENCRDLLNDKPLFFLINLYTTGLSGTVISNVLGSALSGYGGTITADETTLPINRSQKILPAGISGRWSS